jgi:hypothetical protein
VGGEIDLRGIGWGGMDWIDMAQDMDQWRVFANAVMNLRAPQNEEKFSSSCTTGGFSGRAKSHEVNLVSRTHVNLISSSYRE